MPTLFTRIIDGELPARFVWRDDRCVAFLTIAPLAPGHTMVVPRDEVDHWIDLPADLIAHLVEVARHIGRAQQAAFAPSRVALLVVGEEVPHAHLHLIPMRSLADVDFKNADPDPDATVLDAAAESLRSALRAGGQAQVVDS